MTNPYCRVNAIRGELINHRTIISRLKKTLREQKLSLIVVFPTLGLLEYIQDELLKEPDILGYGGIRFLLFEGFINEMGAELGLSARKPSLLDKDLLLARICRELADTGQLPYLQQIPFNPAFRTAILGGIGEWKRSGLTPTIFTDWADEKGAKERELALFYQRYQDLLAEYGFAEEDQYLIDIENRFLEIACAGAGYASPKEVILYGFHDLTPLQNDFIKALSPWCHFEALVDPTPVPLFQEFTANCFAMKLAATPDVVSDPSNALQMLQQNLWTQRPHSLPLAAADDSIRLLQTAGSYRESTAIARAVRKWLNSDPIRNLEDVLIIDPDPQDFIQKARPIFQEYQLNLGGIVEPVREFPAVNQVTQAFRVITGDWQWRDVTAFLRHDYAELVAEADRLVWFLGDRYGAVGGKERWLTLVDEVGLPERLTEIGLDYTRFQEAIHLLAAIPEQATLESYLCFTRDYLGTTLQKAARTAVSPGILYPDQETRSFRNLQAAQLLIKTIGEILTPPDLSGDLQNEMTGKDFQLFYEGYLLPLELAPLPSQTAAIRVIHPREARGIRAQLVLITGLEQGHFPGIYVNDWKIVPSARFELKLLGIVLETGESYQIQEKLAFYWSLQAATEQLFLVYQDQDENGQPRNRSSFLEEILEWFPGLSERTIRYQLAPNLPSRLTDCYSAKETQGRLACDLITPLFSPSTTSMETIPESTGLSQDERIMSLALLHQSSYQRLILQIDEWSKRNLGSDLCLLKNSSSFRMLNRFFGPEAIFPVTILEDYLHCPLRFYWKHLLKIKPLSRPEQRPGGLDLGILYHQVLHDFGDLNRRQPLDREQTAAYQGSLQDIFEQSFREWREKAASDLESLFLEIEAERIRKTLHHWLKTEFEWAGQTGGRFRFAFLEFAFGFPKGDFDPDSLPKPYLIDDPENPVRIAGKIDRVDADENGRFIVYDYKLGAGPSGRDLLDRKQLQIPVYLLALEQLQYGQGCAVGGSYLGLTNPARWSGGVWRSAQLPFDRGSQTCLSDQEWCQWLQEVRQNVREIVRSIRDGQFAKIAAECLPYCEFRESCRRREWEVEGDDETAAESSPE